MLFTDTAHVLSAIADRRSLVRHLSQWHRHMRRANRKRRALRMAAIFHARQARTRALDRWWEATALVSAFSTAAKDAYRSLVLRLAIRRWAGFRSKEHERRGGASIAEWALAQRERQRLAQMFRTSHLAQSQRSQFSRLQGLIREWRARTVSSGQTQLFDARSSHRSPVHHTS